MSAFFEWDTSLVERALREKLAQMGHSLDPGDYSDGHDDWVGCDIDVPEVAEKEFYTNAWDVNIECDYEEGSFTAVAYPYYASEARTEMSVWITLADIRMNTTKVPVGDLEGDALDWAVTKAEGLDWAVWGDKKEWGSHGWATSWEMAGPIIEREKTAIWADNGLHWEAENGPIWAKGSTPLVAAMRCHVAKYLGTYYVNVPSTLLEGEKV